MYGRGDLFGSPSLVFYIARVQTIASPTFKGVSSLSRSGCLNRNKLAPCCPQKEGFQVNQKRFNDVNYFNVRMTETDERTIRERRSCGDAEQADRVADCRDRR